MAGQIVDIASEGDPNVTLETLEYIVELYSEVPVRMKSRS